MDATYAPLATAPAAGPDDGTTLDELVAQTWCKVLGLETVEPHHDFHSCGGHSLHALRIVHVLRRGLDVEIELLTLLNARDLADFTETVRASLGSAAPSRPALVRSPGGAR